MMSPSNSSSSSRHRYPDRSLLDWGSSLAISLPPSQRRRSYGMDAYSEMELPESTDMRADGGLLSAEELPPGRVVVWE